LDKKIVLGVVFLISLILALILTSGAGTDCGGSGGTGCAGTDHFTDCATYGCFTVENASNGYKMVIDGGGFLDNNNPNPIIESDCEITNDIFRVETSGGTCLMTANCYARLRFTGTVSEDNKAYCTPPANSFIIQDSSGNCVAYIDSSGNLWLRGRAGYNASI